MKYEADLEQVTSDITRLYELSLAVGRSLDLTQNCSAFIRTLTAMKGLSYSAVWIKSSALRGDLDFSLKTYGESTAELVFSFPHFHEHHRVLPISHPMFSIAEARAPLSISAGEEGFTDLITEKVIHGGVYALFNLSDIGLLKMFTARNIPFSERELNQLENVVSKFTFSVEGCLLHERLLQEIAQRMRTEEALQVSEERMQLALRGADLGLWDWNPATGETFFDKRWIEMLGYATHEVAPQIGTWENWVHPDDRNRVMEALRMHLGGGTALYEAEYRLRTRTGDWKWILDRSKVVKRDEDGLPLRVTGTHFDISDRKRAEHAVLKEKEQRDSILEGIGDGVIVLDAEGRVVLSNPVARSFFSRYGDLDPGYGLLKDIEELITPVDSDEFEEGQPKKKNKKVEIDGRVLHVIRTPMEGEDGGSSGEILVFHDMTREYEINRLKTEFVSSVSHELRTPLASIKGFAATILRDPDMPPETREEFLNIIDEESDRLTDLIGNLLDLSRIESGRIKFQLEDLDLGEILASVVDNLGPQAEKADLNIETHLLPLKVLADRDQLILLVTNLVSNAIKFTRPSGTVTLQMLERSSGVEFTVSDTGIGIPEEDLTKIFERFHRVSNKAMLVPGTGLGLAIVKEIADVHGWMIQVTSELEQGTQFRVRFSTESFAEDERQSP